MLVEEINTMGSEIMVHLKCEKRVQQIADFILSKGGMTIHVGASNSKMFIVVTKCVMSYKLKKLYPDLELISPGIMLYAFECVK